MKNKFFSPSLYFEGIKQSRSIGLPYAALVALLFFINISESNDVGIMAGVVMLSVFVAIPLMCLTLFHFLNTRSGSDMYHSIPVSRTAVFTSYGAAVYTWAIVPTIVYLLLSMGWASIAYIGYDWTYELQMLAVNLLAGLHMMGAVLLAMSFSSTVVSQIAISIMILFLPRGLIGVFVSSLMKAMPIMVEPSSDLGWLLSGECNLIYNLSPLSALFGVGSGFEPNWKSTLYTLVLSAILIGAALVCFNKRRSETAISSAPNVYVQTAVRVLVAMVFCLFPCGEIASDARLDLSYLFTVEAITWYGLALIAYLIYEIISQRGVRGVARAWKSMLAGLAVLVVLNAVFIGASMLTSRIVLSDKPEADEISSVSLYHDGSFVSFERAIASTVELDDPELIKLVARELSDNINFIKSSGSNINMSTHTPVEMTIRLNSGRELVRCVYVDNNSYDYLLALLEADEELYEKCMQYPSEEIMWYVCSNLNELEIKALYEMYITEQSKEGMNKYELFGLDYEGGTIVEPKSYDSETEYEFTIISIGGEVDGKPFESYYTVSTATPNTAQMYVTMMADKNQRPLKEILGNLDDYMYLDIMVDSANLRDDDGNYSYTYSQYYYFYEDAADISADWERVRDELIANADTPVDISKPFFSVRISGTGTNKETGQYDYFTGIYFVPANETDSILLDWQMQ